MKNNLDPRFLDYDLDILNSPTFRIESDGELSVEEMDIEHARGMCANHLFFSQKINPNCLKHKTMYSSLGK